MTHSYVQYFLLFVHILDLKKVKEFELISASNETSNQILLGWFKYRRNSPRLISFKEKILFNAFQAEFKQLLPKHLAGKK